jgi:uncharacterized protein (DUF924 family)
MSKVDEVLNFWFGKPGTPEYGKPRSMWFKPDPLLDERIRDQFAEVYHFAAEGILDGWREYPASCLALIIVLDQFPRNLFRGKPEAFATDDRAIQMANYALELGHDRALLPVQRWFIYLPFEHSEQIEDQRKSIELFAGLAEDPDSAPAIVAARTHFDLIQTFGRFPHRNQILGRQSTPAEVDFLARPDGFKG